MSYDYIRDGAAIYALSFATIRAEADLARFTPAESRIAVRVIHACGMVEVAAEAGISVETLRTIETGRIPTPAFFTVAAIAAAVRLPLDSLRETVEPLTRAG